MNNKKIVLSGITATGQMTIGNYIGAIKNFIDLQNTHEMYIFVANLHAITSPIEAEKLRENSKSIAALYLACGLKDTNALFIQSDVPEHAELGHILLCQSNMGELSRMTQFKDKSEKSVVKQANKSEMIPTGLFTYPTLMAADIILYQPDLVPVGIDQKQHLELTQNLIKRVNHRFGNILNDFEGFIPKQGAKIMSLNDASKKMSKSSDNPKSYIALLDSKQDIIDKIMSAKTDGENKVLYNIVEKPEVSNLLVIYSSFSGMSIKEIELKYKKLGYKAFKQDLATLLVSKIMPIQKRYYEIINSDYLRKTLKKGAKKATIKANETLNKIKDRMGLNIFSE